MSLSDRQKEFFANLEKAILQQRASALGPDGYAHSEPFVNNTTLPAARLMKGSPTASTDFATPEYEDDPVPGSVGTRHETVMLHSYIPSGITGPDSCQTFVVVSSAPASNSVDDIDAVRMKPLIGPVFSKGRATAAEADPTIRGFELALYPALDNAGTLIADTSNGPIPLVADPGAGEPVEEEAGASKEGFWYVDYDNGLIRFSRPPLNGSNGVMNPNNVFGDKDGNTDPSGAITMFATFYEYTGGFGVPDNLSFVTVGDGYVSSGTFTGTNQNYVQAAINSLPDEGGAVFIKEGNYDFVSAVTVPVNVDIIGVGGPKIKRPTTEPAFIITDGYNTISGLEVQARGGAFATTGEACISLRSSTSNSVIYNVTIEHNHLDCVNTTPGFTNQGAPGIQFAVNNNNVTYEGLRISNNVFNGWAGQNKPVTAIGLLDKGGSAWTIDRAIIENNISEDFESGVVTENYMIWLGNGSLISNIWRSRITNNLVRKSKLLLTVGSAGSGEIRDCIVSNNILDHGFEIVGGTTLANSIISNNQINAFIDPTSNPGFMTDGNLEDSKIINNTITGKVEISDTQQAGPLQRSEVSGNYINGEVAIGSSLSGTVSDSIIDSNIINAFGIGLTIETGIAIAPINDTIISNNMVNSGGFWLIDTTGNNSAALRCIIIDNQLDNNFSFWNTRLDDCVIVGNMLSSMNFNISNTTANALVDCVITGNYCSSGMSVNTGATVSSTTTIDGCVITGNRFRVSVTYRGTMSNSVFSGNATVGGATMEIIDNSVIANNSLGTATFHNLLLEKITDTVIGNNVVAGNISISDTSGTTMLNSTMSGNFIGNDLVINNTDDTLAKLIVNSVISNNTVVADVTLGSSISTSDDNIIFESALFSNNYIGATFVCSTSSRDPDLNTYAASTIANNHIIGNTSLYGRANGTHITGNHIGTSTNSSDFTLDILLNSKVSGNIVSNDLLIDIGSTTGAGINSSEIVSNKIFGNITVSNVAHLITANSVFASVISENDIDAMIINGACSNSSIKGNFMRSLADAAVVGDILNCDVSLNFALGTLRFQNDIADSTISNNHIDGQFRLEDGTVNSSVVANNRFASQVLIDTNSIVGNSFVDSMFVGNIGGTLFQVSDISTADTTLSISNSVISNNVFSGTMRLNGLSSHLTFSNNVVDTTVTTGGNISNSIIAGNVLGTSVAWSIADISTSTIYGNYSPVQLTLDNLTDVVISNNVLARLNITAYSSADNALISGNYISGLGGTAISFGTSNVELDNFSIINNYFDGSVVHTPSTSPKSVKNLVFNNNTLSSGATLQLDGSIVQSTISNNRINGTFTSTITNDTVVTALLLNSVISGNYFESDVTFDVAQPTEILDEAVISKSNIHNNVFTSNINIISSVAAQISLSGSNFTNNNLENFTFTLGDAGIMTPADVVSIRSNISDNIMGTFTVTGNVVDTNLIGNKNSTNFPGSTALHLPDGYISTDPGQSVSVEKLSFAGAVNTAADGAIWDRVAYLTDGGGPIVEGVATNGKGTWVVGHGDQGVLVSFDNAQNFFPNTGTNNPPGAGPIAVGEDGSGNELWVLADTNQQIWYSSDAVNWFVSDPFANGVLSKGIAYGVANGRKWVVTGLDQTTVRVSSTGTGAWSNVFPGGSCKSVAYNGTDTFMIVGSNNIKSWDGFSFTNRTPASIGPGITGDYKFEVVEYGGGVWVAAGKIDNASDSSYDNLEIQFSTNGGITWQAATLEGGQQVYPTQPATINSLGYDATTGLWAATVGDSGGIGSGTDKNGIEFLFVSTDGRNWRRQSFATDMPRGQLNTGAAEWEDSSLKAADGVWVVAGQDGCIGVSRDSFKTWELMTTPSNTANDSLTSVDFNERTGQWVITPSADSAFSSPDSARFFRPAEGNVLSADDVHVGQDQNGRAMDIIVGTSTSFNYRIEGEWWERQVYNTGTKNPSIVEFGKDAFGNNYWVMAGGFGRLFGSRDGRKIEQMFNGGVSGTFKTVTYEPTVSDGYAGTGLWFAATDNLRGQMVTSYDGQTWNKAQDFYTTNTAFISDIAANDEGNVVVVMSNGDIFTSIDGFVFSQTRVGGGPALNAIGFGGGTWKAVGNNALILASEDGATWVTQNVAKGLNGSASYTGNFRSIKYANQRWVAVGDNDPSFTDNPKIHIQLDTSNINITGRSMTVAGNLLAGSNSARLGSAARPWGQGFIKELTVADRERIFWYNGRHQENTYRDNLEITKINNNGIDMYFQGHTIKGLHKYLLRQAVGNLNYVVGPSAGIAGEIKHAALRPFDNQTVVDPEDAQKWVAVGTGGTILGSTDGLNWTAETPAAAYVDNFNAIVWQTRRYDGFEAADRFVAVGNDREIQVSTGNGTWVQELTGPGDNFQAISSGIVRGSTRPIYLAVGDNSLVYSSQNQATTWTARPTGLAATNYKGVAFGSPDFDTNNWEWMMVGSGGAIHRASSFNNSSWFFAARTAAEGFVGNFNDVATDQHRPRWVVVGDDGEIQTSTDTIFWRSRTIPYLKDSGRDILKVSYGAGMFVAITSASPTSADDRPLMITSFDGAYWRVQAINAPAFAPGGGGAYAIGKPAYGLQLGGARWLIGGKDSIGDVAIVSSTVLPESGGEFGELRIKV